MPIRSPRPRRKVWQRCATPSSRGCARWERAPSVRCLSASIASSGQPGRGSGSSLRTVATLSPGRSSSGSPSRQTGATERASSAFSTSCRESGYSEPCGGLAPCQAMRAGSARRGLTSREVGVRIGIFGGTFDPVHQGHMIVAEQVMTELDLARVVFVPGGIPPHKEASSVRASATDRLAMVEAAVEGNERFTVDRVEIDAGRPMHSVETVSILKERSPDDLYFITGADEV